MSPSGVAAAAGVAASRTGRRGLPWRTPPLALRNVVHGGRRSLAAISGVAFSLTMVLLQLGFLEAVRITARNNYELLDFDVILLSPYYEQFYAAGFIPLERLTEARSVPGVVSAAPLYATFRLWRCPAVPVDDDPGPSPPATDLSPRPSAASLGRWFLGGGVSRPLQRRELFVLGIDLGRNPFVGVVRDRIEAASSLMRLPGRVLLNEESHPDFGWQLRDRVQHWELGGSEVKLAGGFPMLRGFAADSTVICDDTNFAALCRLPSGRPCFGLLKVEPGSCAEAVSRLREALPGDVQVLGRDEILVRETDHWVNQTSTGQLFAFGVLIAMIVAAVVVYQVLSNDVREHLPEYATLKAMGYSLPRLYRVVVEQALLYMIVAYLVAVILAIVVYRATEALAGIPMRLTPQSLAITLGLAIVVGLLSGGLSVSKLRTVQPADLF
ncbi:FtsX-like permease family protein [Aquisphaera giovannonii]|uniref:FtsX-like permease family protein n=1 Tax=Aquisphaera giovannonii TaxID=406548 RepID=A0A5B9VZ46_9BACT|nr:FtsX-like permease family protein [Aquisphaera giovannonii]QEH33622.1 FtsX-like permease family protein [Aquisphaera giovannonii]